MNKYFKPKSLTWLASFAPIVAGCIVALASAFPEFEQAATVINAASGGLEPAVLINAGLVGIGLRGAVE
jgi:hypothetical protein